MVDPRPPGFSLAHDGAACVKIKSFWGRRPFNRPAALRRPRRGRWLVVHIPVMYEASSRVARRLRTWSIGSRWSAAVVLGAAAYLSWLGIAAVSAQRAVDPSHAPSAWAGSQPQDLTIKLVTFGPGDDVFNYFGHNAMIVEDRAQGVARLYNFGMFHFGPDMLPNYMKGKLTFWVGESPVRATFQHYKRNNRSIRVQELNLTPARRKVIADELARAALPENREYLYDHFFNNCSTRLRDLVDLAVMGQFKDGLDHAARMTYRQHIRRYAQRDPITDFGLVFWMNDFMERHIKQWDELFLPEELEHQVARAHYRNEFGQNVALVETSYVVYEATDRQAAPEWPNHSWVGGGFVGGLIALVVVLTALWAYRSRDAWSLRVLGLWHALFGLALGLPGLLGALMWAFTEHTVTYRNENLFLSNPLTFALCPLGVAMLFGSTRATRWARAICYLLAASSLLLLPLKLLPGFVQDVSFPMSVLLPANLGFALAHRILLARSVARAQPLNDAGGEAVPSA